MMDGWLYLCMCVRVLFLVGGGGFDEGKRFIDTYSNYRQGVRNGKANVFSCCSRYPFLLGADLIWEISIVSFCPC